MISLETVPSPWFFPLPALSMNNVSVSAAPKSRKHIPYVPCPLNPSPAVPQGFDSHRKPPRTPSHRLDKSRYLQDRVSMTFRGSLGNGVYDIESSPNVIPPAFF